MSAWETTEMANALSEEPAVAQDNGPQSVIPGIEPRDTPAHEWAAKTAYDYSENNDVEWMGNAAVYHWDGDEGDIGPEIPELEKILFGDAQDRDPQGLDFQKIDKINVTQEGLERIKPIADFDNAGLHPAMLYNVKKSGYKKPTPIQRYCIPAIKMGHDLIAIAQTGSGKTAAYLIPILSHLMGKARRFAAPRPTPEQCSEGIRVRGEPLVVIVCPARELAIQIFNETRKFCYRTLLRPCVAYGGGPLRDQINQIMQGCDVLVASPGRLIDMMERPDVLSLRRVKYMVIDEADEMLDVDWQEELNKILTGGEQEEGNIKYMLFSATFPTEVRKLARQHLAENHIRVKVGRVGSTHENIKQDIVFVEPQVKKQALRDLLFAQTATRTIVFVNNKRAADEVDDFLYNAGLPCTSMHADRTQREREDAMRAFRKGTTPILVTTGVAARGIDVRNVMHVINYDLPSMDHGGIQEYIHRIGRTGRIGHVGLATSFYTERDEPMAEILAMTLLETGQVVPDFLERFVEGQDVTKFKFEYGSDEEEDAGGETGGETGGWGAGADNNGNGGDGGGWGAGADQSNGNGAETGNSNNAWAAATGQGQHNAWGAGPAAASGGNASANNNNSWGGGAAVADDPFTNSGGNASGWGVSTNAAW
ncbi:P-loop containing nucleoside triphosphate hydrolase protein [Xylariaceae sp. FL0255]|nr:P-loop containing nucleoside triphosphate hydrolase protein [Xylariaceae sp. FL0255]